MTNQQTELTAKSEEVAANVQGLLPAMFREAGVENVAETKQFMTVAGALSFYRGQNHSEEHKGHRVRAE